MIDMVQRLVQRLEIETSDGRSLKLIIPFFFLPEDVGKISKFTFSEPYISQDEDPQKELIDA
jgi:hypothetical protein